MPRSQVILPHLVKFIAQATAPFTADQASQTLRAKGFEHCPSYTANYLSAWYRRGLLKLKTRGARAHPAVYFPAPGLTIAAIRAPRKKVDAWTPPAPTAQELKWREFRATLSIPTTD